MGAWETSVVRFAKREGGDKAGDRSEDVLPVWYMFRVPAHHHSGGQGKGIMSLRRDRTKQEKRRQGWGFGFGEWGVSEMTRKSDGIFHPLKVRLAT